MLRAILVDDEADGRDVLAMLLQDFCPEVNVIAACATGKEAIQAILKHQPDLLFMDVDMPGMNGFDVLDCIKDLQTKVIFVTAHNQYAIKAFKYSAIDYLLKPIAAQALVEAVQKAGQVEFRPLTTQFDLLTRQLKQREQLPDVIALPMADGLQVVSINDIMYCRADRNYTHIHLTTKEKLLVSRPLKDFDQLLPASHGFFRVHHSSLINLKYVSKYIRGEGGYLEMKDNAVIEVARARKVEFLNMLQKV